MRAINRVLDNLIKLTVAGRIDWQQGTGLDDDYQTIFNGVHIIIGSPNVFLLFTTSITIGDTPNSNCKVYRGFKTTRLNFVIGKYLRPIARKKRREETKREKETLEKSANS